MVVGAAPLPPPTKKALAAAKKLANGPSLPSSKGVDPASSVVDKKPVANDEREGRPDKAAYDAEQDALRAEIDALQAKSNDVRARIQATQQGKGGPVQEKKQALRAELDALRGDQAKTKAGRGKTLDQVKAMQEGISKKIKDLQAAKAKLSFKSVAEVDNQIKNLDAQVNAGQMKLVDEKKALMEISQLKKTRKTVESFAAQQAAIDSDKAKIDETRAGLDDPEAKAISDKFNAAKQALDKINAEQAEASKGRDGLYEERNAIAKDLDAAFGKKKASAAAFKEANNKYYQKLNEDRAKRLERQRAERQQYEDSKRSEINARLLEEAQAPAFERDIEDCRTLIDFFQRRIGVTPTQGNVAASSLLGERKEIAGVGKLELRQVESEVPKGATALKKKGEQEEEYFMGGGGKKGRKGDKGNAATAPKDEEKKDDAATALQLPFSTLSGLLALGIPGPLTLGEVPKTIEALETKKKYFVDNQARVTKEKIAAVEKKIAAADAKSKSNGASTPAAEPEAEAETSPASEEKTPAVKDVAPAEKEDKEEGEITADAEESKDE